MFCLLRACVCVCMCNVLNRTKKFPVQQKEIPVYCTNSPILSWTAYTLKMVTARSSETLIVTCTWTSSEPCPRSLHQCCGNLEFRNGYLLTNQQPVSKTCQKNKLDFIPVTQLKVLALTFRGRSRFCVE